MTDSATAELRFRTLLHGTHGAIRSFAVRRVAEHAVDDVVADTYLVAWRRLEQIPDGDREALLWLYRVAQYGVLNAQRGARRRYALARRLRDSRASLATGTDRLIELDDTAEELASGFASLSEDDRAILLFAAWEGLTGDDLAAVLGISPGAAATRLSRARTRLEAAVRTAAEVGRA